jgi:hypothetical protein
MAMGCIEPSMLRRITGAMVVGSWDFQGVSQWLGVELDGGGGDSGVGGRGGGVGFGFVVGMPWRAGVRGVGVVDQLCAGCGVSGAA